MDGLARVRPTGWSREVGAKPTRCRHCKRGALTSERHFFAKRRMGRRGRRDDPRARIPGHPGRFTRPTARLHAVRRPVVLLCLRSRTFPFLVPSRRRSPELSSTVSGRAVPRATVEVIAADGTSAGTVFTDVDGTFRVQAAPDGCRVRAALTGFQPATAECGAGTPLKLTLAIAPVAEQIVVSATRTEAPAGPGRVRRHRLRRGADRTAAATAPRRSRCNSLRASPLSASARLERSRRSSSAAARATTPRSCSTGFR